MSLSERRAAILRLIIGDYIDSAQPIGSDALVQRHGLGLSSATIRAEMARLEEQGYITHPHTSAGRVPSERGYRYFVEALMGEPELPADERLRILHQFHQATSEVAEWLQLAASVLARTVHNAAVVTAPRGDQPRLKHIQLVALHEFTALLIVVTADVKVRQQVIASTQPASQDDLTRVANRFSHEWAGMDAIEIRALGGDLSGWDEVVYRATVDILGSEGAAFGETRVDGVRNVLEQPEFSRSTKALELLEALDEHNLPLAFPAMGDLEQGVTVIIGSENRQDQMRDCSVIIAGYGGAESARGAIAVLGPTRMHYPRAIATVSYMADVMSELLRRLYGAPDER